MHSSVDEPEPEPEAKTSNETSEEKAIYDVAFEDPTEFNEWINFDNDNDNVNDDVNDNVNDNVIDNVVTEGNSKFVVDDELLEILEDYNNSAPSNHITMYMQLL